MKKRYKICAAFDTETTNVKVNGEWRAFAILYIVNDLRKVKLKNYVPSNKDDVRFFKLYNDMLAYIDELVAYGKQCNIIPVVCAYNLAFDLQTIIYELSLNYDMEANAQSSTNIYTLDLITDGKPVLRFWDCYHLEMNGLAAMGETCGFKKAVGSWDYSKIRTISTPLSVDEYNYARVDVQVIPSYLRYLLSANKWLDESMFGCEVITKTSLVRQQARREIGNRKIKLNSGRVSSLLSIFEATCKRELPYSYYCYALRKACFRGGFTFTSAKFASVIVNDVYSLDVVSMHHAFINGRYVPLGFTPKQPKVLQEIAEDIIETSLREVLSRYHKPFFNCIHACIRFENVRLKENSAFAEWHIGLLSTAKFRKVQTEYEKEDINELNNIAYSETAKIYGDKAYAPVFAFGKLYSAKKVEVYLSEIELWNFAQVYAFDSMQVLFGESTGKNRKPSDYVSLQSNYFYKLKDDVKQVTKYYKEGEKYTKDIPSTIHKDMQEGIEKGTLHSDFLAAYYNSTVKGMFNGIYGTQAQDVFKPSYKVVNGELCVDENSICNINNFSDKLPKRCRVHYNYGLRIVAGSRMHLIIAIILLHDYFQDTIKVLGGDTDSLKISAPGVNPDTLLDALAPLHRAIHKAIDLTQRRNRTLHSDLAATLRDVGFFEVENKEPYPYHIELWNKARVSVDGQNLAHVTMAGLPRPRDLYNAELFINECIAAKGVEWALANCIGYSYYYGNALTHTLERTHPKKSDMLNCSVVDYKGEASDVCTYEAIALYPCGRWIGEIDKRANSDNMKYLKDVFNRIVFKGVFMVDYINGVVQLTLDGITLYEQERLPCH